MVWLDAAMIRIEKSNWIPQLFARVSALSDVLTEPAEALFSLSKEQRNRIRNTQAHVGDVVRVLGHHHNFSLVMKIDGSNGWMHRSWIKEDPSITGFIRPSSESMDPLEFLKGFEGVPYLWGGLSKHGIDCSGLTQLYFLNVFDKIIPRNSREQRKFSPERPFTDVRDHDLVYGLGRVGQSHHVGLFLHGNIWHAYSEEGVACHNSERFSELFRIESVNSILQESSSPPFALIP
jgi:NlpC/P60 family